MHVSKAATHDQLDLDIGWVVSNGDYSAALTVPGDVHSALLVADKIADPYW